jgi:hypothetical protein
MTWPIQTLEEAHEHCFANERELLSSERALCIACAHVFPVSLVSEWLVMEGEGSNRTGFCPVCSFDTLIGDAAPFPVLDVNFGLALNKKYFDVPHGTAEQWNAIETC